MKCWKVFFKKKTKKDEEEEEEEEEGERKKKRKTIKVKIKMMNNKYISVNKWIKIQVNKKSDEHNKLVNIIESGT